MPQVGIMGGMRSVRMQLLVSHLLLVLLLGIVLSAAISSFVALGRGIDRVLEGNYESIIASKRCAPPSMATRAGDDPLLRQSQRRCPPESNGRRRAFATAFDRANGSVNDLAEAENVNKIAIGYRAFADEADHILNGSSPDGRPRALRFGAIPPGSTSCNPSWPSSPG